MARQKKFERWKFIILSLPVFVPLINGYKHVLNFKYILHSIFVRLTNLILEQFRNYQKLEVSFLPDEPITYIVGDNAQGKTNILEAIYLLALTKSFRTKKHDDMILWDQEFARVTGIFEACLESVTKTGDSGKYSDETIRLEAFLGKPPQPLKVFRKNNVKVLATDFIGNCQVVFFHPEDLNMLYLGPDLRRSYLNVINVQTNRKYFRALRYYQRALKQRNALLHAIKEGRARKSELGVWDEQLAEHGSLLIAERANAVEFFRKHLRMKYRKISQGNEEVSVYYLHALRHEAGSGVTNSSDTTMPSIADMPVPEIQILYRSALEKALVTDLHIEATTVGPHRDDLEFTFNNRKLSVHASRGEYRSLLLALKLLELEFFEKKTGEKPILLLDDVFSELDLHRQKTLLEAIDGHQAIITATHLDELVQGRPHAGIKPGLKKGQCFEIMSGRIGRNTVQ